jgi:F-type H+-transporting ATPase subunit epsilon
MKLKISTPAQIIFEGEVSKIDLPTENGTISISAGHVPMVTSMKPGLISIRSEQSYMQPDSESFVSTSKGMAFVDGKVVRIVTAEATCNPNENTETLQQIKEDLENKIAVLQTTGSVEEIEKNIIKLEKVNADIQLKQMQNA